MRHGLNQTVQILQKGAEATIYKDDNTVLKKRTTKTYRHAELDQRLRKERTRQECRLLNKLSNTPTVHDHDDYTITLEYVTGSLLTEVIEDEPGIARSVGSMIAAIHDKNIYHGDLTTSNIIIADQPVIIDFGLGGHTDRVEDKAVDLYLLRKALRSKHNAVESEAWDAFLAGYKPENKTEILERYDVVCKRGRYK